MIFFFKFFVQTYAANGIDEGIDAAIAHGKSIREEEKELLISNAGKGIF